MWFGKLGLSHFAVMKIKFPLKQNNTQRWMRSTNLFFSDSYLLISLCNPPFLKPCEWAAGAPTVTTSYTESVEKTATSFSRSHKSQTSPPEQDLCLDFLFFLWASCCFAKVFNNSLFIAYFTFYSVYFSLLSYCWDNNILMDFLKNKDAINHLLTL